MRDRGPRAGIQVRRVTVRFCIGLLCVRKVKKKDMKDIVKAQKPDMLCLQESK